MKIATHAAARDGSLTPNRPIHHDRLTFDAFKKAYGGGPVADHKAAKVNYVAEGFSLWKTSQGRIFAIRDE
jgi:hypothetical protein